MDAQLSVIVAPDSFKGSLAAVDVAAAIARGWTRIRPQDRLTVLPQADGGEGTLEVIAAAVPGAVWHEAGSVAGPDGRPVPGVWLELPGRVAAVELAQCSGIALLAGLDPLGATTRGLGEVIRHALQSGVESLIVGLGGSASTDGGAGALTALGLALLDADGSPLGDGGGELSRLHRVDADGLLPAPPGGVTLLADVTAPLLGPRGAAAVFGPQKGATEADIRALDAALGRYARLLGGHRERPGAGAAGGTAYGLATMWGARIEAGAQVLQRLTGLEGAIATADVLLTGEGRFDATSMTGKVVGELLGLAEEHAVRTGIIAGRVSAGADAWTCALEELAGSADLAMADPVPYLERAGSEAARQLATIAS